MLLSLALGAALAAIVAMTGVAREAEAAFPGANGRIVFESDRTSGKGVNNPTGDVEIFAMNRDGTGVTQLTNNTADDFDPSYSAKGEVSLFSTNRDGNIEIYVMDSDGTDSDVPVAVRNLLNVRNTDGGYEFTLATTG